MNKTTFLLITSIGLFIVGIFLYRQGQGGGLNYLIGMPAVFIFGFITLLIWFLEYFKSTKK